MPLIKNEEINTIICTIIFIICVFGFFCCCGYCIMKRGEREEREKEKYNTINVASASV